MDDDHQRNDSVPEENKLIQYRRRNKTTTTTSRDNDLYLNNTVRVLDPVSRKMDMMDISDKDEPGLNESMDISDNDESGFLDETHLVSMGLDPVRTGFGGNQNQSVLGESSLGSGSGKAEEKGKGKLLMVQDIDTVEWNVEPEERQLILDAVDSLLLLPHLEEEMRRDKEKLRVKADVKYKALIRKDKKKRLRARVLEAGSSFAHFEREEEEEAGNKCELPVASMETEDGEDRYSIAKKIIVERKKCAPKIDWVPVENLRPYGPRPALSSLQDLCLKILAKGSEAIPLECLPNELRDKLIQLVCDSQKMDCNVMDRVVYGAPSEIRVKNCSLITEEQLERTLGKCDTKNLTVLQLDLCGRCMSDHVLRGTLARSQNSLPALASISLRGACRLTDVGVRAIVGSAPALNSVDLGDCSLITSKSVDTLADSLGPLLKVLHIDNCQFIDAFKILPALKKLKNLEVLSVAGIESVCDDFVSEFITECGSTMKELNFADCGKLTDISLKVIGERCHQLCSLNLFNLHNLSDYSMRYLASGCQSIQKLKLCRNKFSDEAVAAFLEAAGQSLTELSLNYVKKVGRNTAISIANRCSEKLLILDLSWCRSLIDEEVGFIVDKCSNLRLVKLFGCSQITDVFLEGHSNSHVQIFGLNKTRIV